MEGPAFRVLDGAVENTRYTIRNLCAADRDLLIDFFFTHSPETILFRYGYAVSQMTAERAARLVGVDQIVNVGLGAFRTVDEHFQLEAVARYYTLGDRVSAEFAIVVKESMRRKGLGTALFNSLKKVAVAHGIKIFVAQVAINNYPMRTFIERYPHNMGVTRELAIADYYIKLSN